MSAPVVKMEVPSESSTQRTTFQGLQRVKAEPLDEPQAGASQQGGRTSTMAGSGIRRFMGVRLPFAVKDEVGVKKRKLGGREPKLEPPSPPNEPQLAVDLPPKVVNVADMNILTRQEELPHTPHAPREDHTRVVMDGIVSPPDETNNWSKTTDEVKHEEGTDEDSLVLMDVSEDPSSERIDDTRSMETIISVTPRSPSPSATSCEATIRDDENTEQLSRHDAKETTELRCAIVTTNIDGNGQLKPSTQPALPAHFPPCIPPGTPAYVGCDAVYRFRAVNFRNLGFATSPVFELFNIPLQLEVRRTDIFQQTVSISLKFVPKDDAQECFAYAGCTLTLVNADDRCVVGKALMSIRAAAFKQGIGSYGDLDWISWADLSRPEHKYFHDDTDVVVQLRMRRWSSKGFPAWTGPSSTMLATTTMVTTTVPPAPRMSEEAVVTSPSAPPSDPRPIYDPRAKPRAVGSRKPSRPMIADPRNSTTSSAGISREPLELPLPMFARAALAEQEKAATIKEAAPAVPDVESGTETEPSFGDDGDLSEEVILIVEDKKLRVRKHSLRKHVRFFRILFSDFVETKSDTQIFYKICDTRYEEFVEFLTMTFEQTRTPTAESVHSLLSLSDKFENRSLRERCFDFLMQNSASMDSAWLLYIGSKLNCARLVEKVLAELDTLPKVQKVIQSKYYGRLKAKLGEEVLMKIKSIN